MKRLLRFVLLIALTQHSLSPANAADYLRDVKPLLEHKCYACHGALKQQGGLRLDTAASLLKGGESGSVVIKGRPEDSLLIDVLTGDAGFQMPPANEGARLTSAEIDLVRNWILDEAPLPEEESPQTDPQSWWSYQPNNRPPLPVVKQPDWCRNEVDYFVAAVRDREGLSGVPEVDRTVWMRRVFLDLIGLPPTREELHGFLADNSPSAYETIVDDLLSRPQYGERWGRHWMDVWRYSDWYGSRAINEIRYSQRHIWRWRDWIVASLNTDKGYDRMIREMLAADEISGDDNSVLPATGFLGRNWYKFDRNVWMFETVERTGQAFLGLTFRCCRCHDHKFDPITQEEYYRFRAFFEPHDVRTDPVSALTTEQKDATLGQVLNDGVALVYDKMPDAKTFRFDRGDDRFPDESNPLTPGIPAALGGSVDVSPIDLPVETWYPLLRSGVRETLLEKADAAVTAATETLQTATHAADKASAKLTAAETADRAASPASTSEPDVVLHDDFSAARPDKWETVNGTWTYADGRLSQTDVTSFATMVSKTQLPADVHIHLRYRTLSPGTYRSVGFSFDYQDKGNSQDIYTSIGDSRQSVQAFHRVDGKQTYPTEGIVSTSLKLGEETGLDVSAVGSSLSIDLNGERELDYTMPVERRNGRFALWVHQGAAEFLELRITKHAESVETLARKQRDAIQAVAVAEAELNVARGEVQSVRKRLAADVEKYVNGKLDSAALPNEARAAELAVAVLRAQASLAKASSDEKQKAAAEQALTAAKEAATAATGDYTPIGEQFPRTSTGRRSGLAEWIVNRDNPRTARVAVNHIWGRHFGQPLVATPDNFGLNGRQPTHPQLLDWLAAELISSGWSMKSLHRKLVLSATYRMSSQAQSREPTALAAGVLSDAKANDPGNRFLWRMNSRRMEAEVVRDSTLFLSTRLDLKMGGPEIPETDGEKILRRSLYFRNTPNEKMLMLEAFDVADPNGCYQRKESVVPQQALAMMNSGLTLDAARTLAENLSNAKQPADFVTAAFETVLCRKPSTEEQIRCETFLTEHSILLETDATQVFSAGGSAKRKPATDPRARARENLIHVLFLHNDFVTVR